MREKKKERGKKEEKSLLPFFGVASDGSVGLRVEVSRSRLEL